jgi:hypothetical protein
MIRRPGGHPQPRRGPSPGANDGPAGRAADRGTRRIPGHG